MIPRSLALAAVITGLLWGQVAAQAQPDSTARDTLAWNEADLGFTSFRMGGGILIDYVTFAQDDESKAQFDLDPGHKLRDLRVFFSGRFDGRGIGWQAGIMYDEPSNTLRFRQTGFIFPLSEPWGRVFVGRTKEGTSLNKHLVGYYGWNLERFPFSDAVIPILADGIRWYGYLPSLHLVWNVGAYVDWYSEVESFSKDETQYATRLAWISDASDSATSLLHVGLSARYGRPDEGEIRFRSRPQSFRGPYYLDTGTFAATETYLVGPEIYYRTNRLLTGGEYYLIKADAPDAGDPILHGGEIFVSWLMSNARRSYNEMGGVFGAVVPARSVLDGGHGAWDLFLSLSYTDFDDEGLEGGIFWRLTPGVNWYLTRRVRLEFAYGYGKLDRFDLVGTTQFIQNRIQLTF